MKLYLFIIINIFISFLLSIINYNYFLIYLSIVWYISSIIIIYSSYKLSFKYKFIQFNIKKIFKSLKYKKTEYINPISSLFISLAGKIGVGSLSGIALSIYYGGIGTIFWFIVISLFVSINTYYECILGTKYKSIYGGGPSYYINKLIGNKYLSKLYGILIVITYSCLFLSIQSNTIIRTVPINKEYVVFVLVIITLLIILKGIKGIASFNNKLVPIMLVIYLGIGFYILINNIYSIPGIIISVIKEAFKVRSIIPVFLIGMQRAIFITESGVGTSAISSSLCNNKDQGLLEILGIYIIIFLVCFNTFIIIVFSDYTGISFNNINGIEILLYAFSYHFGNLGRIFLIIITIMFAYSTIISSFFFGENNLKLLFKDNYKRWVYILLFIVIIFVSCYIKSSILWNLTDYLIAILIIINVLSIIKISNKV